ncbi:MAG: permease prefix domain 1-containing protein [Longimicrobiales bacterium]
MMLHRLMTWLSSLFLRRRQEREMGEEMGQHIERATSRLMARGLPQAEAERQAHREFGNMVYLQETARDARGSRWVESIGQASAGYPRYPIVNRLRRRLERPKIVRPRRRRLQQTVRNPALV